MTSTLVLSGAAFAQVWTNNQLVASHLGTFCFSLHRIASARIAQHCTSIPMLDSCIRINHASTQHLYMHSIMHWCIFGSTSALHRHCISICITMHQHGIPSCIASCIGAFLVKHQHYIGIASAFASAMHQHSIPSCIASCIGAFLVQHQHCIDMASALHRHSHLHCISIRQHHSSIASAFASRQRVMISGVSAE